MLTEMAFIPILLGGLRAISLGSLYGIIPMALEFYRLFFACIWEIQAVPPVKYRPSN